MYEVIIKSRFEEKIYYPGDIMPEHFAPPESWLKCGIVKEIIKPRKKKEAKECLTQED